MDCWRLSEVCISMTEANLYSVVLCSYNKLTSLQRVARQVKKLRADVELILADDHSTDGSVEWAGPSGLFSSIHSEPESGNYRLNSIRNAGISLATRRYVILLDCDCLPEDTYLHGYDEVFRLHPNSAAIGVTKRYDSTGEILIKQDCRLPDGKSTDVVEHEWNDFYGGNVAFPKILWIDERFDESYNGNWGFEDLDIAMRWSRRGVHFFMSPLSCARHLDHPPCKQSLDAHSGRCINRELFESKHGGKFLERETNMAVRKKILICKNVKPQRNGRRNPKDYPYWGELIDLLGGHDVSFLDKEVAFPELKEMILGCDFWISPDSFFQHFAWSLGKVGVVIFSVTDPLIFGHPENMNILKNRSYLRKNQFIWMDAEVYNPEAFMPAQSVFEAVSKRFMTP